MSRLRQARSPRPGALLLVLCAATFMSSLDLFIVNVALKDIGQSLGGASLANLSWILNAYAIVFAALLVPAGRLADRYGTKAVFVFGLGVFSLASLGCALSNELWLVIALRGVQAIGAAALVPTSLGLILTAIPAPRRQSSIQIWAVSGSLGAAVGPAVGGLLTHLSWRWIFVINVPVGLIALVAAVLLAPNIRHAVEESVPDLLGGLLLIVAIGALTLALVKGPDWGWASASTLSGFAISAAAAAGFVARSRRHRAPVVDLTLFHSPAFAWANIAIVLLSVAFSIQLLGLVLWLQDGWGFSPLQTGLAIVPGPAMFSVTALGLRRYAKALPAGLVAAVGTLLLGLGGVLIAATLTATPNYAGEIVPGWMVIGAGFGFALPTIIGAGTSSVAAHQTSTASAIVQMGRQIGSVLGVATLIIILGSNVATAGQLARFTDAWWGAGGFALAAALAALRITLYGGTAAEPAVATRQPRLCDRDPDQPDSRAAAYLAPTWPTTPLGTRDAPEVAFDAVDRAGAGWGEHDLGVRALGPYEHRGGLAGGEVVGDHVDPQRRVVAHRIWR
jgi:EmrB/QacA subfamily drug resistance transporter